MAGAIFEYSQAQMEFQSFFYWNCLGGRSTGLRAPTASSSFNPSFTGIALVARSTGLRAPTASSSFNPSFTGIALVAPPHTQLNNR